MLNSQRVSWVVTPALPGVSAYGGWRIDISRMLELWPGGKGIACRKHRPLEFWISNCGFRIFWFFFFNPHSAIYIPQFQWPARSLESKVPHDFCMQCPCPRAGHRREGPLYVAPLSIRFERFTVFHPSGSAGGYDCNGRRGRKLRKATRLSSTAKRPKTAVEVFSQSQGPTRQSRNQTEYCRSPPRRMAARKMGNHGGLPLRFVTILLTILLLRG
jgi:hypothetical protein